MRGNNAPRYLVPHQINVQLRRYPESALFRGPSLIGKASGGRRRDQRSNRWGSTIFKAGVDL